MHSHVDRYTPDQEKKKKKNNLLSIIKTWIESIGVTKSSQSVKVQMERSASRFSESTIKEKLSVQSVGVQD